MLSVDLEHLMGATIEASARIFFPHDRIMFFPPYLAVAVVVMPFTTWLAFWFANFWPPIPHPKERETHMMNRANFDNMVQNNILNWIANAFATGACINILYYDNLANVYLHGNGKSPVHFAGQVLLEVVLLILNYDLWTYMFHRACHSNKFLFRWLHAQHHENSFPNNFWMSIYGDSLEGSTIACFAMSGLFFFRVWLGSALLFLFYITFFVAVNHSGRAVKIPYFYSAYYHNIHHREMKYNFTEHLPLWDYIFGTLKWQ